MCRSNTDGYRRCKSGAHGKIAESYQKALYYRAKKSGKTINQWVTDNPEDVKRLQDKRDARLAIADAKRDIPFCSPHDTRQIDPRIAKFEDCMKSSKKELGILSKDQFHALRGYTGMSYEAVNRALLGVDSFEIADWEDSNWRERERVGSRFKSFDDAADYISELDTVLKERHQEERITYRGIVGGGISNILNSISGTNHYTNPNGIGGYKFTPDEKTHATKMLVDHYKEGTQIKFDSYVSTGLNPSIGADWAYDSNNSVGIIYEIKTNAGKNVSSVSNIPGEREVLLPRGLNFKVVNSYVPEEYKYQHATKTEVQDRTTGAKTGYVVIQLVEVDEEGNEVGVSKEDYIPTKKISGQSLEREEFDRIEKMLEEESELDEDEYVEDEKYLKKKESMMKMKTSMMGIGASMAKANDGDGNPYDEDEKDAWWK